jgi:4,5-DOPA dioxygenase extradiol
MNRKDFLKVLGMASLSYSMNSLKDLTHYIEELPTTEKTPLLFLGHGSPMNAIEENQFVEGFRKTAKTFSKPKAIICISAHWLTRGTKVTAMPNPRTIHDFGGFPKELFEVQYPAKGSPELAKQTKETLLPTQIELDDQWGLDHGAWSVLKHLYPDADVPVIQMSIDYYKPASYHFELAKKLQSLREKGILIVGSGNIIHNLGLVDFRNIDKDNYGYDWAIEARELTNQYLLNGDFNALVEYQKLPKSVQLAVPTPDHYLPLIYILGLKTSKETLSLFNDKLVGGSLSMTSVKIS